MELEAAYKELQSTNANRFLESVLTRLRSGLAVVDRDLWLLDWNRHAEELWDVRAAEVRGQHLLNLDIGLPVQRLRNRLKVCLTGGNSIEPEMLEAVNRRGKKIAFQVTCAPLYGSDGMVTGGILVMDEIPGPGADRTVS